MPLSIGLAGRFRGWEGIDFTGLRRFLAPPQYRVLMPEHQQPGILRRVTAERQDGQAEHPAREHVDDLEQHPPS